MKQAKKQILALLFCLPLILNAQSKKQLKLIEAQLKKDIEFLADDNLEGRRTGTIGEKVAAAYIESRFKAIKLAPFFEGSFMQTFDIVEGKKRGEQEELVIFDSVISQKDYTPLPFCANETLAELIFTKLKENGSAHLIPISKVTKKNLGNPHDDALEAFEKFADSLSKIENTKGVLFYNDISTDYDYTFISNAKSSLGFNKVAVYLNYNCYLKNIKPNLKKEWIDVSCVINNEQIIRQGINVAGFINNNAAQTVVLGAHYDHLGFGEDHNSLFTDTIKAIHNGADDNASGVGALLALGKLIKEQKKLQYNYLLIAFSGEELGLFGSKKFIEQNPNAISNINYMVNMDMMGRFDNTKNALTIGGVGTSPTWIPLIQNSKPFFTPNWDSAGVGPSDHTSFYLKDKPVLFFFTGLHLDYHKPSDDANKINYTDETKIIAYINTLIATLDKQTPLVFTKTREPKMEGAKFKVTLGIMPDYTFSGNGVKADGVTAGRVGDKAGMKSGDIILQLGDTKTVDIQAYMQALSKFKKGETTTLKVKRGDSEVDLTVTF